MENSENKCVCWDSLKLQNEELDLYHNHDS